MEGQISAIHSLKSHSSYERYIDKIRRDIKIKLLERKSSNITYNQIHNFSEQVFSQLSNSLNVQFDKIILPNEEQNLLKKFLSKN